MTYEFRREPGRGLVIYFVVEGESERKSWLVHLHRICTPDFHGPYPRILIVPGGS